MDKQTVIERLSTIPAEIAQAESKVIEAQRILQQAKDELADKEAALLLGRVEGCNIDGKNAEQRSAQLRQYTETERAAVVQAEEYLTEQKAVLSRLYNELKVLQSIARLLAVEVNW